MATVLALVVPLGLAGALSPVMLTEQTVVLSGPGGLRAGSRYAAGAVLVLVAFVALIVLSGRGVELPARPHLDATLDLVVGAPLLGLAYALHRRVPRPSSEPSRAGLGARAALGFGVFSMATNFTTLALVAPAAKEIGASGIPAPEGVADAAVLVALASLPAWAPVALTAAAPAAGARVLGAVNAGIERYGRRLTVALLAGAGAFFVVRGIVRLAGL